MSKKAKSGNKFKLIVILTAVAVVAAITTGYFVTASMMSNSYYNQGEEKRKSGDRHLAIALYDKALGWKSNNSQAMSSKALCCAFEGQFELANDLSSNAILIEPSSINYRTRARIYSIQRNNDKAWSDINTALSINSNDERNYYWKGTLSILKGDYIEARKCADKSIELGGDKIENEIVIGDSFYFSEDYKNAEKHYEVSIPKYTQVNCFDWCKYGRSLLRNGKKSEAEACRKKASLLVKTNNDRDVYSLFVSEFNN